MKDFVIGAQVLAPDAATGVERIALAEKSGVQCAWLTCGGTMPDPLVIFGAAAMKTQHILLGTSVVPTFPRHPMVLVQAAIALDSLAPGRLRLGVGPSHKPLMEGPLGIAFERPLEHLTEYLKILRAALHEGKVDFDGKRLHAHAEIKPTRVSVLGSALRANAFTVCGELADGAISWMCPLNYMRDVALPALQAGASKANRKVPALIAHVPVMVCEDAALARATAREQFGIYPLLPYYRSMFVDAGFPEANEGMMSDRMIDEVVIHGGAEQVKQRLRGLPSFGVNELLATPVMPKVGADPFFADTMRVLGELAAE